MLAGVSFFLFGSSAKPDTKAVQAKIKKGKETTKKIEKSEVKKAD